MSIMFALGHFIVVLYYLNRLLGKGDKTMLNVTYKNKGDRNEKTKEFNTLQKARGFYDSLNEYDLLFAILSDKDGNVLEEKRGEE